MFVILGLNVLENSGTKISINLLEKWILEDESYKFSIEGK